MIIREQVPAYMDALWNDSLAHYVTAFEHSRLPFGVGVAALIWLVLFIANLLVARRVARASDSQAVIVAEGRAALRRGFLPLYVFVQVSMAAMVFPVSAFVGEPFFVVLGGGQLVCVIFVLGLNVHSLLSITAMARANAVEGQLKLSVAFSFRQVAQRLIGAAVTCVLLALLLAHLALLGGAVLLGATAAGHLRRARHADARASLPAPV
jgi:hypothetical protein